MRLLITGSQGLIGTALTQVCAARGCEVVPFDLVRDNAFPAEDICDADLLAARARGCDGIIHLAAISRVAWGEARPDLCHKVNVEGTQAVIRAAAMIGGPRWILFASSREVYGNPERTQVRESDPIAPVNAYGRSKAEGEQLIRAARDIGIGTAILRFSNVYGGRRDHPDRAVPSLLYRALQGEELPITGGDNYFDFVHVNDCVNAIMLAVGLLSRREKSVPTVHLATGIATTLRHLAELASDIGGGPIRELPARTFDVAGFCGAPMRAREVLGWQATIDLPTGLRMLAEDLRANGPLEEICMPDAGRQGPAPALCA